MVRVLYSGLCPCNLATRCHLSRCSTCHLCVLSMLLVLVQGTGSCTSEAAEVSSLTAALAAKEQEASELQKQVGQLQVSYPCSCSDLHSLVSRMAQIMPLNALISSLLDLVLYPWFNVIYLSSARYSAAERCVSMATRPCAMHKGMLQNSDSS